MSHYLTDFSRVSVLISVNVRNDVVSCSGNNKHIAAYYMSHKMHFVLFTRNKPLYVREEFSLELLNLYYK